MINVKGEDLNLQCFQVVFNARLSENVPM